MKARPTEYKGIRFRSKSEAVFARYLDLCIEGYGGLGGALASFDYEPETLIDGWNPDFLTWRVRRPMGGKCEFRRTVPFLFMTFIEYKPSRPTKTYIAEWAEHVAAWSTMSSILESDALALTTTFYIFYGSVFSSAERGVVKVESDGKFVDDTHDDWLVDFEEELLAYRFDLEQEMVT